MTGSITIGDLALRLYESGRHDAVCDALDMVVRCGGSLNLRDLLIFGMSANCLGRVGVARWCQEQARELACQDDALAVEVRGLIIETERRLANTASTEPTTNSLTLRVQQRNTA